MYIKSYSKLSEINYFFKKNLKNNFSKFYTPKIFKSRNFMICLNLFWLNKTYKEVGYFQTNNYFINAISVTELSHPNELEVFLKEKSFCTGELSQFKNNNSVIRKLGEIVLKEFNKNIADPITKLWTKNKKNFFKKNGYVIIPNVFTTKECDNFRKICLDLANKEKLAGVSYQYGFNNKFQRVFNVLNKSFTLGKLIDHPLVNKIMNDIFDRETLHDKYTLSSHHINIVPPGGEEQKLHSDSAVPDPLPTWMIRANVNFILEDYNDKNGSTVCIPGSHLFKRNPTSNDLVKYKNKFKSIHAKKGSIVIWSGHLWHKSGNNITNKPRVALLTCFTASYFIEMALEENNLKVIKSDILKKYSKNIQRLVLAEHGLKKGNDFKHKFI